MRIMPMTAALLLATGLTACSSSKPQTATPSPLPPGSSASGGGTLHEVKALSGNRWSVTALDIKAGDVVRVVDTDPDVPHNFVVKGLGQSPALRSGDTYELRFPKPGTYGFVCTFHADQGMTGTVKVS